MIKKNNFNTLPQQITIFNLNSADSTSDKSESRPRKNPRKVINPDRRRALARSPSHIDAGYGHRARPSRRAEQQQIFLARPRTLSDGVGHIVARFRNTTFTLGRGDRGMAAASSPALKARQNTE